MNPQVEQPLQWFLDGSLIFKNKEKIGTARPIVTPEGVVTGYDFVPEKNLSYTIQAKTFLKLRELITLKANDIRRLNLGPLDMKMIVETVHKVRF